MEKIKCLNCGILFETKKQKTCSRKCADEYKSKNSKETRRCVFCNNEFLVRKKVEKKLCSDECRKSWSLLKENKDNRIKKSQESIFEKYGVKSNLSLDSSREKARKTKKEKYGDENYVNLEKARKTKKEKYGDENYVNLEKARKTKKEKYGDENYNNRKEAKNTMKDKYGVDHAMNLKYYQKKQQDTLQKNYGVEFPLQNLNIKDKVKKTNIEKYGFDNPSKNDNIKQKISESHLLKFDKGLMFEKLLKQNLQIISPYIGLRDGTIYYSYNFKCLNCNNVFSGTFTNNRPPVCRTCNPLYKNNTHQIEFRNFLLKNNINFTENDKQTIKPYELDFYLPDYNLAIELNGNYYHSEIGGGKDKNYHIRKTNLCLSKNIQLLHFFEDEIVNKQDIIQSMILSKTGLTNKIFARKCKVLNVSYNDKKQFLNQNHIQGDTKDSIRIGLYEDSKLVALMTFIKLRKTLGNKEEQDSMFELVRFCTKLNYTVVGGFSKLLSNFIKSFNPVKIVTFSDNRSSHIIPEKTVYYKNNFIFINKIPPRYWYFKKGEYLRRYHRFQFNKNKLLKQLNRPNLTEWDIAQLLGMDRIWDCGNLKFEMVL